MKEEKNAVQESGAKTLFVCKEASSGQRVRKENAQGKETSGASEEEKMIDDIKSLILKALESLDKTRWMPEGTLTDWVQTREGKNHAAVFSAKADLILALCRSKRGSAEWNGGAY